MYHYWECPRCQRRSATQSAVPGAYASPRCDNAPCNGAQMAKIGEGAAPVAPPPAPAAGAAPALNDADQNIYTGAGTDRGRAISWTVTLNEAQQQVAINLTIGTQAFGRPALMHSGQLSRAGLLEEKWLVSPSTAAVAGSPNCWMRMPSRSEQLQRLGSFHKIIGITPPAVFEVECQLGNAHFGLIHLLAGHTNAMRGYIGTDNPAQDVGDEGYRTIQGVQAGIAHCLNIANLQMILYGGVGKWIFVGKGGAFLVTDGLMGGSLKVTTFYKKTGAINATDKLYWKRRGA